MKIRIALVDDHPNFARRRELIILDESKKWMFEVETRVFGSAGELIGACEGDDGEFFDVILSDVFMPADGGRGEGSPEEGGIRIKRWLEARRQAESDYRSVQLRWVTRLSDVRDIKHEHVTSENSSWMGLLSEYDSSRSAGLSGRYIDNFLDEVLKAIRWACPAVIYREDMPGVVARSAATRRVYDEALMVARSDSVILIIGETGTGKEVLARTVHKNSNRSGQAFVAVNCAATPESLIESELFGHERGSFTGAERQRKGQFVVASGGTLFLDEIGDASLGLQAKLLRALQDKKIKPVGSDQETGTDVRVIAATHKDLPKLIKQERFREDLYYRLNVIPLHLTGLRERTEEIVPMAELFIDRFSKQHKMRAPRLTESATWALTNYYWPGNVRELHNVIERMILLLPDGRESVTAEELRMPQEHLAAVEEELTLEENRYLEAMRDNEFNGRKACKALRLSHGAVSAYLKDHPRLKARVGAEKDKFNEEKVGRDAAERKKMPPPSSVVQLSSEF